MSKGLDCRYINNERYVDMHYDWLCSQKPHDENSMSIYHLDNPIPPTPYHENAGNMWKFLRLVEKLEIVETTGKWRQG
jgi:hypothetical protein